MSKEDNKPEKSSEKTEQNISKTPDNNKIQQINESTLLEYKGYSGDAINKARAENQPTTPKLPVDLTTTVETHNRENKGNDNKE